ncbi:nucleoside 2-deoxyribosyltransferase family protein [Burkholderia thailandensis MSMB121]|uniref:Nucleoside 2-deoxyribosyltransferase n=2 Tax=Burkholderia humptydooensis TaxID=430531 RepID=A0A7U4PA65_9BURK|nr:MULTISPECIES: nucleoside 2-deoxyribosyltransferase [Burkholderia]AGK49974.1 nucleoside 2-deoxyribosyltransferase family protein [Burkholderia thailandensis MSMB121]ATF32741.1 nucleoside 2-deoxyribosyltransferase [Burkholderia thailandensis]AJY39719.1 nucleoside 2-deoxyribosyltransferase family protein [Burkholderia sp. 2002721687]ALX45719.1 nucleoside 2-deoxyribosyltransferase [Burkholderia humptydooensis]EIP86686.1 putative nucleoside 2-deoxyribosyltransferase [Burkholderia humptydooensis 
MKRMFLGGPFKSLVDKHTGVMPEDSIDLFRRVIDHFEARGWDVHCAHRREHWGREFMTPAVCTKTDYEQISLCDYFVAFPGAPASPGTHIELGWASALGKPIVLLLETDKEYAYLVRGLDEITRIERVEFGGGRIDPAAIEAAIGRFEARG